MSMNAELFPTLPDAALEPLARWLSRTVAAEYPEGQSRECMRLSVALASTLHELGHTCVDVEKFARRAFPGDDIFEACGMSDIPSVTLPPADVWRETLLSSGACDPFPKDDSALPLQYHSEPGGSFKFALTRFALREHDIARRLAEIATDNPVAKSGLCHGDLNDEQNAAAEWAVANRLTIITGGPGTGKTTTVAGIISLLAVDNPSVTVRMAAPSGKAATRMSESLRSSKLIPPDFAVEDASTIHRLLGIAGEGRAPARNKSSPIAADAVVIDEASMISAELMQLLLDALASGAKLVLLGDRHQLKSVEPGNILGAICRDAIGNPEASRFGKSVHELRKTYRFRAGEGVGLLAMAVVGNEAVAAIECLRNAAPPLQWSPNWNPSMDGPALFERLFGDLRTASYDDPSAAIAIFEKARILCSQNGGPFGCDALNIACASWLSKNADNPCDPQPIIILENDYDLRLFNGDTGVVMNSATNPAERVAFFRPENTADGECRSFAVGALPAHAPAYAITIHKSQGSEYSRLAVIIPPYKTRVLTRSLLYTAVTRFREAGGGCGILVAASECMLRSAIANDPELHYDSLFPIALRRLS